MIKLFVGVLLMRLIDNLELGKHRQREREGGRERAHKTVQLK